MSGKTINQKLKISNEINWITREFFSESALSNYKNEIEAQSSKVDFPSSK